MEWTGTVEPLDNQIQKGDYDLYIEQGSADEPFEMEVSLKPIVGNPKKYVILKVASRRRDPRGGHILYGSYREGPESSVEAAIAVVGFSSENGGSYFEGPEDMVILFLKSYAGP